MMQASLCRACHVSIPAPSGRPAAVPSAPAPRCAAWQLQRRHSTCSSQPCGHLKSTSCRSGETTGPTSSNAAAEQADDDFEGLLPEEDHEIPGNWMDAMSSNTPLGKAVRSAADELRHLNSMELEQLQQADALLKKLGVKGSLFGTPAQQEAFLRGSPSSDLQDDDDTE